MLSIASLYYQLKKYDESKQWCGKIQQADPQNAEALYRVAVIDFDDSLKKTGLQGENVQFLSAEEREHTIADIDEGLKALDKAIQIRPDYFDAMEYQNLLWREKAKFEKDEKARNELIRQADVVAQKALMLRLGLRKKRPRSRRNWARSRFEPFSLKTEWGPLRPLFFALPNDPVVLLKWIRDQKRFP